MCLWGLEKARQGNAAELVIVLLGQAAFAALPIGHGDLVDTHALRELLLGEAEPDFADEARLLPRENVLERERPDAKKLVTRDSRWRDRPASDKQLAVLERRKLGVPEGMTRGDASRVIGMLEGG